MAFWYTREKMVPGSVFGSKDEFKGLGVFLDTYKNGNQPVSCNISLNWKHTFLLN